MKKETKTKALLIATIVLVIVHLGVYFANKPYRDYIDLAFESIHLMF